MTRSITRFLGPALLASAIAVALAACSDSSGDGGGGYSSGDACNQFTTCGACTPVSGCGWCFNATSGLCAATPDECTDVTEFTWTWDATGCPDLDASVRPQDAASRE
ncbi:MAG TPA: hypothetical protein VIY73_02390 [Polyangiaceae bacterium]